MGPLPFLASGVARLMMRYGLKKLAGPAKREVMRNAKASALRNMRKKGLKSIDRNRLKKDYKLRSGLRAGGNIANDAGTLAGGVSIYDAMNNETDLESYIKKNKPRVWAKYQRSGYSSLKEYLESRA